MSVDARGYLERVLEEIAPSREELAADLIEGVKPRKIEAIKLIRANFGLGLKEAKDLVDGYYQTGKVTGLPPEAPF